MSKTASKPQATLDAAPTTTTRQQQDLPKLMKYGMDIGGVLRNQSTGLALIAERLGLDAMIDDKVTVLKHFPPSKYTLVWFCNEKKEYRRSPKARPGVD